MVYFMCACVLWVAIKLSFLEKSGCEALCATLPRNDAYTIGMLS